MIMSIFLVVVLSFGMVESAPQGFFPLGSRRQTGGSSVGSSSGSGRGRPSNVRPRPSNARPTNRDRWGNTDEDGYGKNGRR